VGNGIFFRDKDVILSQLHPPLITLHKHNANNLKYYSYISIIKPSMITRAVSCNCAYWYYFPGRCSEMGHEKISMQSISGVNITSM
jgi:hypothetical protein